MPSDDGTDPLPASHLWCTSSGQIRGEIDNARAVYEENQNRLSAIQNELALVSMGERKKNAMTWLQERVFSHRKPCELNPRFFQ